MPRHKSNSDVDFRADRRKEVIVIDDGESLAANRPRRRASIPAAAKLAALARSEKAGDDDDCLIVSESIQTPRRGPQPRKSRGGASVAANMRRLARTTSLEVELHMECVEEALSYYQVQAAKRAEEEYRAALQQIRVAQAEVAAEQQRQLLQQQEQQAKRNKELQQQLIQMRQQKNQITIAPSTGPHADMMLMNKPQVIAPRTMQQKPRKQIINPVRYDNIQTTNRNTVQGSITYASPVIAGALNSGVKRPLGSDFDNLQIVKRRTNSGQIRRNENEAGSWVPLDEYYYGKKEGDPAYREEKGEFRFKCWFCHKMLYNNVRMMLHMQAHIDSEKQQNLDLSDLTQCKQCYKQFDTPFDMQCHIERVHQNTSNVLVCRICEKDHENQIQLRSHMKTHHTACEMPYICQLCNFRSSIYSDVVDHFKKRHDSSQHTMCLYCLRVFRINFSKQNGWGLTQNYWQHLQRHQALNRKKKCPCCKLTFINAPEVKVHKTKDHLPNQKGAGLKAALASQNQGMVMIQVPEGGGTKGKASKPKSLNAPSVNKVRDLRGLRFSAGSVFISNRCLECQEPMSGSDHFKRYVECSMCRYATTCNNAYSNHMMAFHTGSATMTLKVVRNERRMDYKMYCLCGFSSNYGNSIANHLVFCSKRTAYSTKPEPKWFEYDDEQEDFNPFESYVDEPDVPEVDAEPKKDLTLLGALGLVKKKSDCSTPDLEEETPDQVVQYAVSSVLDAIFPAEAAAEEVIDGIMSRLEEHIAMKERLRIAEELKKAKASNEQSSSTGQRPPKTKQKFGRPKVSIMGGYKAQKSSKVEERDLPTPPSASHEDSLQSFDDITSRDDSSTVVSREEDSLSRDAYSESGFRDDGDSLSRDSEDPPKDSAETLFAKAVGEEPKDAQSQKEMGDTKIDEIKSEDKEDKEVKSQGTPTDSKDNEEQDVPMDTEEDPKPTDLDETPMDTDQDKTDTGALIEGKSENEANETALKSDANEASGAAVEQMDTEDTEHPQGTTKTMDEQDEEAKSTMDTKSDNAETDSVEATLLAAEPKLQSADLEEPEADSEPTMASSEESEVAEPAKDAGEEPETTSAELVKDNEEEQEKTSAEPAKDAGEEPETPTEPAMDAEDKPQPPSAEPAKDADKESVKHVSEEQPSAMVASEESELAEPAKYASEEPETPSTEPAMDAEDKTESPSAEPAKDADEKSETPAVEPESAPVEPTTTASEETKEAELKEDEAMNTSEGPEKSEPDQRKSKEVAPEETSEETSMEKSEFKARESHEPQGKETKTEGISPTVDERLTRDKEETKKESQKEPKPEEGETKGSDIDTGPSCPSGSSTPSGKQTSVIDKSADGTKSGEPGQGDTKVKLSEGDPAQKDTKDPVVDTESKPKVSQDTAHQKAASTSAPRKPEHERTETAQSSKGSDSAKRPPSDSFKGQSSHRHGDHRDDRRRDDSHRHDNRKYDNRYGDRDRHGHRDYRDDRGYRDDRHGGRDRYGYQGGSGDYHQGGYRGDRRDQHQDRNRGWGGHNDRRDQHGNRGGGGGGNRGGGGGGYRGGQGNRGGYNRGGYHGYY